MTTLRLSGLSKRFGTVDAIAGIDLTVASGSRTAVVGPSGSGKTTLLRLIAGFEAPDGGEIRLGDMLVADARAAVPPHRRNIGLVMQDGALFPHLSVLENVRFGDRGRDGTGRALELLDVVELGRGMANRRPHELSGGQQQRVALARALIRKPRIMLLDEPFSALDVGLRQQLRQATAEILGSAGVTTVLVTHDQSEAMEFADQIAVLREGVLRQAGTPRDVYLAPVDRETAEFLGPAIFLDAIVSGGIATCSLGTVRVAGVGDGPTTIMLRPEQIRFKPLAASDSGAFGRVIETTFAGPQAVVMLVVASPGKADVPVNLRMSSLDAPTAGMTVSISIVGAAQSTSAPQEDLGS